MALHEIISNWPGKSPPPGHDVCHPAAYHMLDVAAVAEHLIAPFCLPEPERQALVLLAALHDLGKINAAFRSMLVANQSQGSGRHWEVTEALLMHHDSRLAHIAPDRRKRWALYAATAGHHGRPPSKDQVGWSRMCRAAGEEAVSDAGALIDAFNALWPEASLAHRDGDGIRALTWWLPGFVTAADWIGSNAVWFPPRSDCIELPDYLEQAREQAATAVHEAGLEPASPSDRRLFDWPPRPMQKAAHEVPLPQGAMLAIIEDGTGSGKTEAALVLAQRMLRAGKGQGLYVALPTMATADAMFARLRDVIGRMFTRSPSLTLAHGRAALSREFREFVAHGAQHEDEPACTEWLADNRRRALLATVGVGTIDQALLAVLKARHSALRLFGLSSKILIVDEVHEVGEPYIVELLATLLRAHRQVGGSAILLTATLPTTLRSRLIEAWDEAASDSQAYPVLTVAGQTPQSVQTLPDSRGPVSVRRLASVDKAASVLVESAPSGCSLCLGTQCRGRRHRRSSCTAAGRHVECRTAARAFRLNRPVASSRGGAQALWQGTPGRRGAGSGGDPGRGIIARSGFRHDGVGPCSDGGAHSTSGPPVAASWTAGQGRNVLTIFANSAPPVAGSRWFGGRRLVA